MTNQTDSIEPISLEAEMRKSYLDYAMSVIVSRALPDVRDGLKPVHRRILYAMKEGGYDSTKPYRKSARIVGDVMGKYHPHGDSAIYDAMVRMAQEFSLRLPLIDGQGNFGSMDGDSPAAMRYTEARLNKAAETVLIDYDKDTVDFVPNYDDSDSEPAVLPARFPNLLVNGSGGIAVGMATNMAPHNLGEVIDGCCAYVDDPSITIEGLMEYIKGPDFPTGGAILGQKGTLNAYHEGKGSIVMRAATKFEPMSRDRTAIIVNTVPYQVNKAKLVSRISECAREKLIEGIGEVRDESDRDGIRICIELKKDIEPEVVLNQLYTHTAMQTTFGINNVALLDGTPQLLNLRQIVKAFVEFREVVIRRRTVYELNKARDRAHILVGLAVAVANIDEIIALIRAAKDPADARAGLMAKAWPAESVAPLIQLVDETTLLDGNTYKMTEVQARAILELKLHRLTGLERDKIAADLKGVTDNILYYLELLSSRPKLLQLLKDEMLEVKEKFDTPRRTELLSNEFEKNLEDLIQHEDMVVTISHNGYIKRVPLETYRAQNRGGKGRSGMSTRADDFVSHMFVADTLTPLLFFTTFGQVYQMKVYQLPIGSATARGKPIINLLPNLQPGERLATVMPLPEPEEETGEISDKYSIIFATSKGNIRRNALQDFLNIKANGKIAMKLKESGEMLVDVRTATEHDDVFFATKYGRCLRFPVKDLRVFFSRNSTGVKGIKLMKDDVVISMSVLKHVDATAEERDAYKANDANLPEDRRALMKEQEELLLTVTENGLGKRSSAYEYRTAGRGGQGVAVMAVTKRTGNLVAAFPVAEQDQIMLVTKTGQMIRCGVDSVRIAGRTTQGVKLFDVAEGEAVISVAHVAETEEGDEETATEA